KRVDEDVRPLEIAHHADEEEVRGARHRIDGSEFAGAEPVIDEAGRGARGADLLLEGSSFELRYEENVIGEAVHQAFEGKQHPACGRRLVIVKATAMSRVEASG